MITPNIYDQMTIWIFSMIVDFLCTVFQCIHWILDNKISMLNVARYMFPLEKILFLTAFVIITRINSRKQSIRYLKMRYAL